MAEEREFSGVESERVSRLSGGDSHGRPPADGADMERRAASLRADKPKRADAPRSYSTLRVTDEEKLWAAVAHASVWLTLVTSIMTTGMLVPVSVFVPLIVYFMFRRRSDYVAFHALQAFVLQLAGTVGAMALFFVGGTVWVIGLAVSVLLMVVLIGFILVPVWGLVGIALLLATVLLPLAALLFGTIAAVETYNGHDYRYPFLARWIDRQLAGALLRTV